MSINKSKYEFLNDLRDALTEQNGKRHLLHRPTLEGFEFDMVQSEDEGTVYFSYTATPVKLKRLVFAPED